MAKLLLFVVIGIVAVNLTVIVQYELKKGERDADKNK